MKNRSRDINDTIVHFHIVPNTSPLTNLLNSFSLSLSQSFERATRELIEIRYFVAYRSILRSFLPPLSVRSRPRQTSREINRRNSHLRARDATHFPQPGKPRRLPAFHLGRAISAPIYRTAGFDRRAESYSPSRRKEIERREGGKREERRRGRVFKAFGREQLREPSLGEAIASRLGVNSVASY